MSRRHLFYLGFFLCFFFLAFAVVRTTRSQGGSHRAFVAFEVERHFDAAGSEGSVEYKIIAVRSDGSSAWYANRPAPDSTVHLVGAIYDVPSQRVTSVDGFTDSVSSQALTSAELKLQKTVDSSCQSGTEHSSLLGYDVVKITEPTSATLPAQITEWHAPALNCYSLSGSAVIYKNGQPGPKTTREVLYVIPGEPQDTLFAAPANYSERSPSQASDEFARRYGHAPFSPKVLDRAEQKYRERR